MLEFLTGGHVIPETEPTFGGIEVHDVGRREVGFLGADHSPDYTPFSGRGPVQLGFSACSSINSTSCCPGGSLNPPRPNTVASLVLHLATLSLVELSFVIADGVSLRSGSEFSSGKRISRNLKTKAQLNDQSNGLTDFLRTQAGVVNTRN